MQKYTPYTDTRKEVVTLSKLTKQFSDTLNSTPWCKQCSGVGYVLLERISKYTQHKLIPLFKNYFLYPLCSTPKLRMFPLQQIVEILQAKSCDTALIDCELKIAQLT